MNNNELHSLVGEGLEGREGSVTLTSFRKLETRGTENLSDLLPNCRCVTGVTVAIRKNFLSHPLNTISLEKTEGELDKKQLSKSRE